MFFTIIIIVIIILSVIYTFYCPYQNDNSIEILYRQAARWAVASEQDTNPIIAVLHANYAAGYLWAIKDIVTEYDFERITGTNMKQFEKSIIAIQDKATRKLVNECKNVIPTSDTLLLNAMYGN